MTKGKSTQKLNLIHERHCRSRLMNTYNVNCEEGLKWKVKSEDGRYTYTISKHAHSCTENTCRLKCFKCDILVCVQQYTCNCLDCLIQNTICKHIHLLQRFLLHRDRIDTNEKQLQAEASISSQEYADAEIGLIASHLEKNDKVDTSNIKAMKQAINGKLLVVQQCVEESANGCLTAARKAT